MTNRVAELLGVEKPIIQASMFFLTDAKLVAAVSNAGGFGILGMAAGQDHFEPNAQKSIAELREEIHKTKELTDKPFGLTLAPTPIKKNETDTVSGASKKPKAKEEQTFSDLGSVLKADGDAEYDIDADEMTNGILNLAKEEKLPAVMMGGAIIIPEWVERIHEAGLKVMFRPTTPEPAIIKKAVKAGVDAIIATGFDEGGTVPAKVVGTFAVIPMVVDAAEGVPVIAAGGITDKRTAKAAFDLGAEGIYAGTAFLASEESPMADNIKEKVIDATAEDMLMFRAPNSFYRSLPGKLPNKLVEMDKQGASAQEIWTAAGDYDDLRQGMLFGDLDKGIASFGLGISMIHAIDPVAKIVDRLYSGIPEQVR